MAGCRSPADADLVFDGDLDAKWQRALAKLGIDLSMLSTDAGTRNAWPTP